MSGSGFPFAIGPGGGVRPSADDDAELRGRIVQVLFTSPGERVNRPDFGCGLLDLVFDPADTVLAAAAEFTIGQALDRWLAGDLAVESVDVAAADGTVTVEVAYVRRRDLTRRAVRVSFR